MADSKDFALASIHAAIESRKALLLAMASANVRRADQGFADAYGEEAFGDVAKELSELAERAAKYAQLMDTEARLAALKFSDVDGEEAFSAYGPIRNEWRSPDG